MNKFFKTVLFALLLVAMIAPMESRAQTITKAGISAAQFLRIPVGARSSAMGGAVAADVDDLSAMFWNPAGLADVKGNSAMIEYGDWFVDLTHNYLGLAMPMGSGVLGVSVNTLTMGDFEETTFDNPEGTGRTFNAYSYSIGVTYAQYLLDVFRIGGTVKYINETISFSSATGIAFDIGTIYTTPFDDIRFGVSVTNFGGKMQMLGDDLITNADLDEDGAGNYEPDVLLQTDEFDMPLQLRVGLAWDPIETENVRTTLTVDATSPSDNVQSISFGAEVGLLKEMIQVRAGVPYLGLTDRTEQVTAGVGLNYPMGNGINLQIGYSFQSYQYLSRVNRFTLGLRF